MKRLTMYITANHASVQIVNGASRETSAGTVSEMIDAMPHEDLEKLTQFCEAILRYTHDKDPKHTNKLVTEAR